MTKEQRSRQRVTAQSGSYSRQPRGSRSTQGWVIALTAVTAVVLCLSPQIEAQSLVISDVTVTEGNSGTTNAVFTVSVNPPAAWPVSVNFQTVNQSAVAGSDFVYRSGTLSFSPYQPMQQIIVPVIGDTTIESNETFAVVLFNPSGAGIGKGTGIGTITDDDTPFSNTSADMSAVIGGSVAWGDYDNDGDLDVLITGSTSSGPIAKVYRNDSGGVFTDIGAALTGVYSSSVAWGDYDNDGDLDIVLMGTTDGTAVVAAVYRNDGGGVFTDIGAWLRGVGVSSVAWGDYDNDGDLDLLLTGFSSSSGRIAKVYRNEGGGAFTDIEAGLAGVAESSVAWGDYDNDGDLDILLTGTTGSSYVAKLYRNDGGGVFTDIAAGLEGVASSSVAWGDYDNDGDLDILLAGQSQYGPYAAAYRNYGGGVFSPAWFLAGITHGVVAWGDYDNDGDLDILLTGHTGSSPVAKVLRNDGGSFAESGAVLTGVYRSSAAWGDYDNDGDLDILLTGHTGSSYVASLYRNNTVTANSVPSSPTGLAVSLDGNQAAFGWTTASDTQTPAAGLTYNLRVGTSPGASDALTPMAAGSGYRRIPALGKEQHGTTAMLKSLAPGSYYWSVQALDTAFAGSAFATEGSFTVCDVSVVPISANQSTSGGSGNVTVKAAAGCLWTATSNDPSWLTVSSGSPGNGNGSVGYEVGANVGLGRTGTITISGQRFTVNQSGSSAFTGIGAGLTGVYSSAVAWGDYDGDGDLDVLLTGTTDIDRIARLYRNDGGGVFTAIAAGLTGVSDGSAAWGDYDNDNDLDLVITGFTSGWERVAKVYHNGGGGVFTDIGAGLPGVRNGSVAWGDYDNDGDLDILLTGSGNSGYLARVYRNEGSGAFTDIGAGLTDVGYSSVAWGDFDNDGDLDILLTGLSSGAVGISKVFRNAGDGLFVDIEAGLPGANQGSVAWGDYDNDGDLDILLTGSGAGPRVYRNDGDMAFADLGAGLTAGSPSSATWGDYDNDGDLDVLLTGGYAAKVYRNGGAGVFTDIGAGLIGVYLGSAAWGDYDNDGDLDVLLTGGTASSLVAKVYRNDTSTTNTEPGAPTDLAVTTDVAGVALSWSASNDTQTPVAGLTYNLRVGTSPGGSDIMSPMADAGGYRRIPALGNMQHGTTTLLRSLPLGTYYWSVQAVDTVFAGSAFAAEGIFNNCPSTIDPASASHETTGGSGSVSVTAEAGYGWTATSNNPLWLTVTSGSSGTGNGSVGYTVAANVGATRTGTVTIDCQTFTVIQAAATCSYAIDPTVVSPASVGGPGTVSVTSGSWCSWSATSNDAWIVVGSGSIGSGSGFVGYTIAANTGPARTGTITISGLAFTVNQGSGCTFSIDPTSAAVDAAGDSGSVNVTTVAGCAWTAISNDGWITVDAGSAGNGTGSVAYSVLANCGAARTGTITVAGQTFTVAQAGELHPGATARLSTATAGTQGDGDSLEPAINADGRYVAFWSYGSTLVVGDTNNKSDIFVRDRQTGATTRVSVASDGSQGNGDSGYPAISADGRYVAFWSSATTLVAGDTNGRRDIFVHDRDTGTTTRVSVATDGTEGNDEADRYPVISADGRYVAFTSYASNLVAGDTNGKADIFVHNRDTGVTARVSVATDDTQGNGDSYTPTISADGRWVAFISSASTLVAGDTNAVPDAFLHDRDTGVTARVSVANDLTQGNGLCVYPTISADGRYVAFSSDASNLVAGDTNGWGDIFVHDRDTGATTRVSVATNSAQGDADSRFPAVSSDGRFVAFYSYASTLVVDDINGLSDVFVHDRVTGATTRVSVASDGTQGNGHSYYPAISADGRYVAFNSYASNLVEGDTNGMQDDFVHAFALTTASVVPGQGSTAGGLGVTLTGTGFVTGASVTLDGVPATAVTVVNSTTITAMTPAHAAGVVDVVVTNPCGQTGTLEGGFTYAVCTISIEPVSAILAAAGGASTVTVTASPTDCTWTATSDDPSWLTVTSGSSGSGDGSVGYSVAANTGPARIGTVTIAAHTFTVNQASGCAYEIGPTSADIVAEGGTSSVSVTAGDGCTWTAVSNDSWIAVTPPGIGSGAGSIGYSVAANMGPPRSGTITIAGKTFTINQESAQTAFFPVTPCRVFDTRNSSGSPILDGGEHRNFDIVGICGIPVEAIAIVANVTVVNGAVVGNMSIIAGNLTSTLTTTIEIPLSRARANNAVLQLATDGAGNIMVINNTSGTVNLILDVNGYFQ